MRIRLTLGPATDTLRGLPPRVATGYPLTCDSPVRSGGRCGQEPVTEAIRYPAAVLTSSSTRWFCVRAAVRPTAMPLLSRMR